MDLETGVEYYGAHIFFVSPHFAFGLQFLTMVVVTFSYSIKNKAFSDRNVRDLKQRIMVILTALNLITYFMKIFIPSLPFQDIIFLLFLLNNSKILKRAVIRSWVILTSIYEILMLQLLGLVMMAYFINIVTFGKIKKFRKIQKI